ncbi:hypothetical protein L0U85_01535 [Glycomyces sp. L485]|uniref:hypothetical protein n=1 Tax=Glycomyces sp. L485 TaxID=2909235 RepID=UPI001F4A5A1A|nr:hypothetical protein [Glycomyces sp. L485]MCH7229550.1 hypothetical protein [Glycomyces sp. L485]
MQEVKANLSKGKDNLSKGAVYLKDAGVAAAKGTREAAGPKVYVMLTKVGLKKARARRWPWVAGAIGAGIAVGGAAAYLWYRQRTQSIGESLLADELLDDAEEGPQITDEAINQELIERVSR